MLGIVIILAIIQGLSEFLPISSSAHLLITPWLFHWSDPGLSFDAAIHLGTALALIIYFWRDIWELVRRKDKLIWYILIASIPGALFGFLGDKWIDNNFHTSSSAPLIVGVSMIVFSVALYLIDHHARLKRPLSAIKLPDAVWVGIGQTLALMPGVSRSGATISTGLLLGFKREDAARFSFLLAIPVTLGAGAYKTLQLVSAKNTTTISTADVIVGVIIAAVVGWLVIKWLLQYLNNHNLNIFVIYRILFGLLVIAVWLLRR